MPDHLKPICRYTPADRPSKPKSNLEIVARATEKVQQASADNSDSIDSGGSAACPPLDPLEWPFALRSKEASDLFRKRAYRAARVPEPSEDAAVVIPKQITVVSAASGEVVSNKVSSVLMICSCTAGHFQAGC